jgi:hypothetical protein
MNADQAESDQPAAISPSNDKTQTSKTASLLVPLGIARLGARRRSASGVSCKIPLEIRVKKIFNPRTFRPSALRD